ncbi:dihydrolipoamide acetyltransferase family protein [Isoptericola sp. NPDC019482]|uniref:dihydrolipoamide acetyltransferase family protein n=1 Tax=Isoptericola sp. NPDC019482 TaxID=3154688 RepID=UPI003488695E
MATREFKLPDLGEGLTESEVVEWRVAVGDAVELNQVIAEVETAKALVELPSPCAGVVRVLHAEEGQTVEVGEPLVTFDLSTGGELSEPQPGIAGPGSDNSQARELSEPQRGMARPGSDSSAGEDSPEPNLVGYGARPARSGRPARRRRRDAPAAVSAHVATAAAPAVAANGVASAPASDGRGERPRSTPVVRALARQRGIDLATVTGTGPHGRITRDDVEAASSGTAAPAAQGSTSAPARTADGETRTPVRSVRKRTAAAMVASAAAPQASVFLTVDVTASMELLVRLKTHPMAGGQRITVLALVARAVLALLPQHPSLTSRWVDLPGGEAEIVRPTHVNLGIAVATDRGLVVPHVPAADTLSLPGLAAALTDLTTTARAGRTTPERLTGGTLTITNIGVFGVDSGTPILNPGEPAILGLGQVARRPWEHDGEVALRQVTTLSLTFDHRVVDGEQGARFLAELGAVLADPALAVLLGGDGPAAEGEEPA